MRYLIGAWFTLAFVLLSAAAFSQEVPWPATQPLSALTGLKKPLDWDRKAHWKAEKDFAVTVSELPKFFSWRFYAQGLTKVRRQANNDCWAQGTTGVLENLVKIANPGVEELLAVQQVISCSGMGTASRGGNFALNYYKKVGGVPEADFPYVGRDVGCKTGLKAKVKYRVKDWGYVGARGRSPKSSEVKQAMMEHGVLGITIAANSALSRHTGGGLFTGCSGGGTNHIEVFTGWNDEFESNGKIVSDVFEVRNSWGESHGEKGYAYMKFGCSSAGTEQVVWADLEELTRAGTYRTLSPLESLRVAGFF